jgi:hypothetical protein
LAACGKKQNLTLILNTMSQTVTQFKEQLAACDFRQPDQVSKLVTSTHTNVAFNEKVEERHISNAVGSYNYFSGLFGKETWPDGQGMDQINEYYVDPYIPFSFSRFIKQMQICDPNLANECVRDRCEIPEGGRGTMPGMQFFRWGLKTPRDCIANIRHIRQFKWWASKVIRAREIADEQIMNMFYTMAAIRTSGHKIVMQGVRENGSLKLATNINPRNPLRGGLYNYMEDQFPQPTNLQDIVPLEVNTLEKLARYWAQFPCGNEAARGPRNESIYEMWFPDDWYYTEAVRNPDYMEKMKILMPAKLFGGYSLAVGDREVVGNFAVRQMPFLPRFAPTSDGRIVPVDSHIGVDIEVGQEFVGAEEFENAPFGLAMIVSGKQGVILDRPPLNESGAGFPIQGITSVSPWRIRNDYDKECNPDLNQPYSEKDYELGFRMDDPHASTSFLFRRRVFNQQPINECDLAPVFFKTPSDDDCPITTVGCDAKKIRENGSITGTGYKSVECTAASCGNGAEAPFTYLVKVERKPNNPDFNSLDCDCGSAVHLFVYDENNEFVKILDGVVKDTTLGFPYARYFVETTTALAAGECIKGIDCVKEETDCNAIDFWMTGLDLSVLLKNALGCEVGDEVDIAYYDADGEAIGDGETVEILEADPSRYYYKLEGATVPEGTVCVGVVCNDD